LRRNCPLKHVIARKIEGTERGGRGCEQILDDLEQKEDTAT
jgi:hypothetical protein